MRNCLLSALVLICMNVMGQDTHRVYCEIVGTEKFLSSKVTIEVDFGQQRSVWTNGRYYKTLVDENGKKLEFQSMVDAMNYMGTLGWKFEQAYVVTVNKQNVYHWLLSKDIAEGELINEGLKTRDQVNKEKKQASLREKGVPTKDKTRQIEDDMYR